MVYSLGAIPYLRLTTDELCHKFHAFDERISMAGDWVTQAPYPDGLMNPNLNNRKTFSI